MMLSKNVRKSKSPTGRRRNDEGEKGVLVGGGGGGAGAGIGLSVFAAVYQSVQFGEDGKTLVKYDPALKTEIYRAPDGVTTIGNEAFRDCANLRIITIPDGVPTIGDRAFFRCKNLKSIALPDSVKKIGKRAFWSCENLEEVSLPRNVELGRGVFSDCPKVKITYR